MFKGMEVEERFGPWRIRCVPKLYIFKAICAKTISYVFNVLKAVELLQKYVPILLYCLVKLTKVFA